MDKKRRMKRKRNSTEKVRFSEYYMVWKKAQNLYDQKSMHLTCPTTSLSTALEIAFAKNACGIVKWHSSLTSCSYGTPFTIIIDIKWLS
jgi:hypothetical protein